MDDKKIFLCAVFCANLHFNYSEVKMEQEEEIYRGCLRGDNRSRKELYNQYAGKLLAIGLRYLGDRETAEDVLHDVFIQVFGSFDKFSYRGKGSLLAWLSRIMVNTSLEHLRKAKISDEMVSIDTLQQLLGINERSSSSQYFRARSLLAKRINEYLKQTE